MAAAPEDRTVVAVFAKAPIPGHTKTRLIALLGAEGAADLQRALIQRTLLTATSTGVGRVELWCAPGTDHPFLLECAQRFGIPLRAQCEGDIGQRMLAAATDVLHRARNLILLGTDCPALTQTDLEQSVAALDGEHQAAFLPVEDGGYTLIALSRVDPTLFKDIAWSTERVMPQTRERLHDLGWRWMELATKWDVDRPQDYTRMQNEYPTQSQGL